MTAAAAALVAVQQKRLLLLLQAWCSSSNIRTSLQILPSCITHRQLHVAFHFPPLGHILCALYAMARSTNNGHAWQGVAALTAFALRHSIAVHLSISSTASGIFPLRHCRAGGTCSSAQITVLADGAVMLLPCQGGRRRDSGRQLFTKSVVGKAGAKVARTCAFELQFMLLKSLTVKPR